MLSVVYSESYLGWESHISTSCCVVYAECYLDWESQIKHFMLCHYAEYHYAECHYAECHYAECRYAECHYTEGSLCWVSWRPEWSTQRNCTTSPSNIKLGSKSVTASGTDYWVLIIAKKGFIGEAPVGNAEHFDVSKLLSNKANLIKIFFVCILLFCIIFWMISWSVFLHNILE
jgi:hypothetical protein